MEKPDPTIIRDQNNKKAKRKPESWVSRWGIIGSVKDPDKRRLDYFKKLMCQGEVSKAFRAITSDAKVRKVVLNFCNRNIQQLVHGR